MHMLRVSLNMFAHTHTHTHTKVFFLRIYLSWWMEPDFYLRVFLFLKAKQSLATLTKDVPKRHSLAMPTETVVNGNNQEWVMQADLPLTAAIRQSQQTLYVHAGHPTDRQGRVTRTQHILPRGHIMPGGLSQSCGGHIFISWSICFYKSESFNK